jgi:hypothetical protein
MLGSEILFFHDYLEEKKKIIEKEKSNMEILVGHILATIKSI